jgi:hypothetical protein
LQERLMELGIDTLIHPLTFSRPTQDLAMRRAISLGTYAIRPESMIRIGGLREFFESAEDIDLQHEQCPARALCSSSPRIPTTTPDVWFGFALAGGLQIPLNSEFGKVWLPWR